MGIRAKLPGNKSGQIKPGDGESKSPARIPSALARPRRSNLSKSDAGTDPWGISVDGGESDSNWMVSYADMVTLLMTFFAMMFSFAKMEEKKIPQIKHQVEAPTGGHFLIPLDGESTSPNPEKIDDPKVRENVELEESTKGINIVFKSALTFRPGSTELKEGSDVVLKKVISVLSKGAKDLPIYVEGHTDDNPMAGRQYPTNWELSAARASLIVRMLEKAGFAKNKLHPVGYGDSQPLKPNRDEAGNPIPENQAENRRVVLRILKPTGSSK